VVLVDYTSPELWCLLQCERDTRRRLGDNYTDEVYLTNIEAEWERRGVCSECFAQMDEANPPAAVLLERIRELEEETKQLREQVASQKPTIGFRLPASSAT
jgi:hypothetical protein